MRYLSIIVFYLVCVVMAQAGPFAPRAGVAGSTALASSNAGFVAWATGWTNYIVGSNVVTAYQVPEEALGHSDCDFDDPYNVCTLGNGGQITMTFVQPIKDTDGFDFAIFENSFDGYFLELAYVEVSADGTNFVRFPNASWTPDPIPFQGGKVDATNIEGLAGKYGGIAGQYGVNHGTPFDLASVGLTEITHIRIVDIVGDGRCFDAEREWFANPMATGDPIYDPHPTSVTGGFDLDAVGVFITRSYEDWRLAKFPYPTSLSSDADEDADPDGDGMSNLLEYAFATNPMEAKSVRRTDIEKVNGHLRISFSRDENKIDLTYIVEATGDLVAWQEIARSGVGGGIEPTGEHPAMQVQETGEGWLKQVQVTDSISILEAGRQRYLRVRIQR